jgi:hypothetical protein
MRLLIGFILFLGLVMLMQSLQPHCSMSTLTGVEWLRCLVS